MTIASTVAVVLRLVARNMSAVKYGTDDLFIMIALVRNAPVFSCQYKCKGSAVLTVMYLKALTYGLNANELIGK